MTFQLSKSQKEIQKAAREFAKGEFDKQLALDHEKIGEFPETVRQKAGELGFIGIHYPETYDGGSLGIFENTLIADAFCTHNSPMGMGLALSGFGAELLVQFGSDALKTRYLPRITDGSMLSGVALTESISPFNADAIHTKAVKDGNEWVINGTKRGVVNGGKAGFYIVLCQTVPEGDLVKDQAKGLSFFLIEQEIDGIKILNRRNKLGMRMIPTSDLQFENVRVPDSHLIGKTGSGLSQVQSFWDESRILVAAMALGTARGSLAISLDYVKQREQFGRKIGQFQVLRHKLADMATDLQKAEFMTYAAASQSDLGKIDSRLFAMAALCACKTALNVSSEAIQLLGGYGYMTEYEVERCHRDAKALSLFAETNGQLKDIIAEKVIGKIR